MYSNEFCREFQRAYFKASSEFVVYISMFHHQFRPETSSNFRASRHVLPLGKGWNLLWQEFHGIIWPVLKHGYVEDKGFSQDIDYWWQYWFFIYLFFYWWVNWKWRPKNLDLLSLDTNEDDDDDGDGGGGGGGDGDGNDDDGGNDVTPGHAEVKR